MGILEEEEEKKKMNLSLYDSERIDTQLLSIMKNIQKRKKQTLIVIFHTNYLLSDFVYGCFEVKKG